MPLIEGIGDEVLQFVAVIWIIAVGALAWWSTNARPERYRTIVVMRSRAHHPVTVSIRTGPDVLLSNIPVNNTTQSSVAATSSALSENREESQMIPLQEMDSIVDADMAMIDHNRLHFYRRMDLETTNAQTATEPNTETESQEESAEPASNAQIREMDSIVSAMEADVTTTVGLQSQDQNSTSSTTESKDKIDGQKKDNAATSNVNNIASVNTDGPSSDQNIGSDNTKKILIKLKYLNDTLREVDGNLDELLKDFKWRHFSAELSSESRVRLIFNGRVLYDDGATLRACGLFDRAVVHCLVHPKRTNNQQGSSAGMGGAGAGLSGAGAGAGAGAGPRADAGPERAWDLENILMTLVSVALTVVWFFRCEYSNMFTASASVALFGLTVFYSVAIFGLYLSDTFHFDRRQPPPAPAPPPPQPQPTN